MGNSLGKSLSLTLFGESHGPYIGAVLDGLTPGLPIDEAYIASQLLRRRPSGSSGETGRVETDKFQIVSGVCKGHTTGTPLTIIIPNSDVDSRPYACPVPRPSHSDYTSFIRYDSFADSRGGGHLSGRLTAALVAAGAICKHALEMRGIRMISSITRCGILEYPSAAEMDEYLDFIRAKGDSVGGIIHTEITGVPAGVGDPWFDSLDGSLSGALMSVRGVKGVEFGDGFALASLRGSSANDQFRIEDGKVRIMSNHSGGIDGGISNGMPIVFNVAVKPVPSISLTQESVNLVSMSDVELNIKGRHDASLVRRIRPVIESVAAAVLYDKLESRFGINWFRTSNVVLIGMPSCGKSTIGAIVAEKLGKQFIDTDLLVREHEGMPVSEVISRKSLDVFRKLESEMIAGLSTVRNAVIATGGGVVLSEDNMSVLMSDSIVIFIDRDVDKLSPSGDRPLARTSGQLRELYNERICLYKKYAAITVDGNQSPEAVAESIINKL